MTAHHTVDWTIHVVYDFHWWHILAALGGLYVLAVACGALFMTFGWSLWQR